MSLCWDRPGGAAGREAVLSRTLLALQRRELGRIVRADQPDFAHGEPREIAQSRLVGEPSRVVDARQRLEKAQARRPRAADGCDLGMMEIRVAAMEEPALRHPDSDAAMAARVTWKRDQQHLVARTGNRAHRREAEPSLAVRLDRRPRLDGGDLHGAITAALPKA